MKRLHLLLAVAVVVPVLLIGIAYAVFRAQTAPPSDSDEKIVIDIAKGTGLRALAAKLQAEGVIKNDKAFMLLARWHDQAKRIKAGEYLMPKNADAEKILAQLVAGEVIRHQVTIPEGRNLFEVAKILSDAGFGDVEALTALMTDKKFVKGLGVPGKNLEGYMFPDTYSFLKGDTARQLLTRMVKEFFRVFAEVKADKTPGGLSDRQVVILASICEEEARMRTEMPMIARVYLNRLRKGMLLQADPTVVYGLLVFDRPLRLSDLKKPNRYNTYLNKGLPPGPISNPGRDALFAVFHPAKSNALYFVAQGDGSHYFSDTYEEHQQAVARWRALKKK